MLFYCFCFFLLFAGSNQNSCRANLKSCSFHIHWLGEIKNSHELPAGRNFFLQFLCLKIYIIKRITKISSWYNKNVTLYILKSILCSIFMLVHYNSITMIDINKSPVLCLVQIKTKISIFSPIFGLTVSFADPFCFAMYCD